MAPGDDPVLQSLAAVAAGAQRGVTVIERVVRLLRCRGSRPVVLATLTAVETLSDVTPEELRFACDWLVGNGHAAWLDPDCRAIRFVEPASPVERGRGAPMSAATEQVK